MSKAFLLLTLALSFSVGAGCIGEAQIIGTVQNTVKSLSGCRVFLSGDTRLQTSAVCPLDEGKLFTDGVEVGLANGHDCKMEVGDSISGILVDNGSFIYLE